MFGICLHWLLGFQCSADLQRNLQRIITFFVVVYFTIPQGILEKSRSRSCTSLVRIKPATVVLKPHGALREDKKTGIEQFDVDGRYLRVCGDSF